MASGILVDVEISVNIRYGYDIRGEVVGENGTVALGAASPHYAAARMAVIVNRVRPTGGSGSSGV